MSDYDVLVAKLRSTRSPAIEALNAPTLEHRAADAIDRLRAELAYNVEWRKVAADERRVAEARLAAVIVLVEERIDLERFPNVGDLLDIHAAATGDNE